MMVTLPDWTKSPGPTQPDTRREINAYRIPDAAAGLEEWGNSVQSIARGISQLGHGIGDALEGVMGDQKKQTDFHAANARVDYLTQRTNLDDERSRITDPAKLSEFGPRYQKALDTSAQQIQDPEARQKFITSQQPDLASQNAHINKQKFGLESDAYRAATVKRLEELRMAALKPGVDDKTGGELIQAGTDQIMKGVPAGYYSKEDAEKYRIDWSTKYAYDKIKTMPPRDRLAATGEPLPTPSASAAPPPVTSGWRPEQGTQSGGGPRPSIPTIARRIYDRAIQKGVNPDLALGIARGEGLIPRVINSPDFGNPDASGRSYGPFQLYTGPQGGMADTFRVKYGALPSAANLDEQIDYSLDRMKSRGTGDWNAVRNAGGEAAITAKGARYAESLGIRSGGGGSQGSVNSKPSELLRFISEDKRQELVRGAYAELKQDEQENATVRKHEVANIRVLRESDAESIKTTGQPVKELTPDRVELSEGPDAAARFQAERSAQSDFYSATKDLNSLTDEEIAAKIAALKPPDGDPIFHAKKELHDEAEKKGDAIIRERSTDPALAADHTPAVAHLAKKADLSNPASMLPLANARMAVQEHLDIPYSRRTPVTNDEAKRLWSIVKDAQPEGELDAVKVFVETIRAAYGEKYAGRVVERVFDTIRTKQELRGQTWRLLNKLAAGEKLTRRDAVDFDTAKGHAAADSATSKLQGSEKYIHDDDVAALRKNPTPQNIKHFNEAYKTPGAAERFLEVK